MYKLGKKLNTVILLLALALFVGRDLVHPIFHHECTIKQAIFRNTLEEIQVLVDSGHRDIHNVAEAKHICSICSSCAVKFCSPGKIFYTEQFFGLLFNFSQQHSISSCSILPFSPRAPPRIS